MRNIEEIKKVADQVAEYLQKEKGLQAAAQIVEKNNNIQMCGLSIREEGATIAPVIYIDNYVIEDRCVRDIAETTYQLYLKHKPKHADMDVSQYLNWSYVKDNVFLRIVSAENEAKDFVKRTLLDMVYYPVITFIIEGNVGSITVKNNILEEIGVTEDEIFAAASFNTIRNAKASSMAETLANLLGQFPMEKEEVEHEKKGLEEMIVVTNQNDTNGAGILACDSYMDMLCDKYADGGNLVVFPSSIHEVIVIPYKENDDMNNYSNMVSEVNMTQVMVEERLVDHAFIYKKGIGLTM